MFPLFLAVVSVSSGLFLFGPGVSAARAQPGQSIRVLPLPGRVPESQGESLVRRTFPGIHVVPTGTGELVVRGTPSLLDQAEGLLRQLDRPARTLIVELKRIGQATQRSRGFSVDPQTSRSRRSIRYDQSTSRSSNSGTQSLRLQEGSSGSFFLGSDVAVPGSPGLLGAPVSFRAVGRSLQVRLVRVDPGKGALLEIGAENSSLGPSSPAGPTFQRDSVGTKLYVPMNQSVALGGADGTQNLGNRSLGWGRGGPNGTRSRGTDSSYLGYSIFVREP